MSVSVDIDCTNQSTIHHDVPRCKCCSSEEKGEFMAIGNEAMLFINGEFNDLRSRSLIALFWLGCVGRY